jgi:hypothetical protein
MFDETIYFLLYLQQTQITIKREKLNIWNAKKKRIYNIAIAVMNPVQ